MLPHNRHASTLFARLLCLALCGVLVFSSIPLSSKQGSASAQSANKPVLKRSLPPHSNLPNVASLLAEGKNLQQPAHVRPALKPSTLCGYRDKVCKAKEKKKKTGQNLSPSGGNDLQWAGNTAENEKRSGLGRLGQIVSGAGSSASSQGLFNAKAGANVFPASNHSQIKKMMPAALANAGAMVSTMPPPSFLTLAEAQLDAHNRVGEPGEDLFSGNYHFSLPLVNLPGRAGLDLNLALSYNSLVWLKYSGVMLFDYDYNPTLTPGFRLGLPEIYGPEYVNSIEHYVVKLSSGKRVGMRKLSTNNYEAIDSSYLYLKLEGQSMTLYTTDGTQFIYTVPLSDGVLRCTQIKDRNGNYLSVGYMTLGEAPDTIVVMGTITDTLGRVVTFNYDEYFHLQTITQSWQGQTFTWAQFEYGNLTIQTNFRTSSGSVIPVDGPGNNEQIPVVTRVITADGARHNFVYNSWGQVKEISRYGEANNQRAAMTYIFPSGSTALSDCPRFSQRNDFIANWAGLNFTGSVSSTFTFAADETWGQVITPDGVTHKDIFSASGGTRGLTTRTETWFGGAIQKFTDLTWVSGSTVSPPLRPRVTDIKLCDDRNHNGTYESGTDKLSRTAITYTTIASTVVLPQIVDEYNEGGSSFLRSTYTDYVLSGNYTSRRLIGLPSAKRLYDGSGHLIDEKDN